MGAVTGRATVALYDSMFHKTLFLLLDALLVSVTSDTDIHLGIRPEHIWKFTAMGIMTDRTVSRCSRSVNIGTLHPFPFIYMTGKTGLINPSHQGTDLSVAFTAAVAGHAGYQGGRPVEPFIAGGKVFMTRIAHWRKICIFAQLLHVKPGILWQLFSMTTAA